MRTLRDQAGHKTPRDVCLEARACGLAPEDLARLARFYVEHRAAWGSPAVILLAVRAFTPGEANISWNIWPTVNAGYDCQSNATWREQTAARQRRETRRDQIIKGGRRRGLTDAEITKLLANEGLKWEDQDG
jgi:hypothetical protein